MLSIIIRSLHALLRVTPELSLYPIKQLTEALAKIYKNFNL